MIFNDDGNNKYITQLFWNVYVLYKSSNNLSIFGELLQSKYDDETKILSMISPMKFNDINFVSIVARMGVIDLRVHEPQKLFEIQINTLISILNNPMWAQIIFVWRNINYRMINFIHQNNRSLFKKKFVSIVIEDSGFYENTFIAPRIHITDVIRIRYNILTPNINGYIIDLSKLIICDEMFVFSEIIMHKYRNDGHNIKIDVILPSLFDNKKLNIVTSNVNMDNHGIIRNLDISNSKIVIQIYCVTGDVKIEFN